MDIHIFMDAFLNNRKHMQNRKSFFNYFLGLFSGSPLHTSNGLWTLAEYTWPNMFTHKYAVPLLNSLCGNTSDCTNEL